ncbi:S8 family serine peptidase [Streptomyces sp. NPDC059255]|uniref:S8 family serine peptidase n=1 Tax=Streptomyces sp. NPDC059255 TaxID=3346793 RepID=UPI0036AF7232
MRRPIRPIRSIRSIRPRRPGVPAGYRSGAVAVAVALAAGLATTAGAVTPDLPGGGQGLGRGSVPQEATVTLITGDRVGVDGRGNVTRVVPAEGREDIRMSVRREGDRTYAIPTDALRLVGQGTVDRRLFDVTGLVEAGYDDTRRDTLPLIVSYRKAGAGTAKSRVAAAGARAGRSLPSVDGQALTAAKDGATDVWQALTAGAGTSGARVAASGISRVWLDGKRRVNLDRSVPQIGAPTAWEAGYKGDGVKVAVIDTGVDQTHPDLAGVEVEERNFSDAADAVDRAGHGTHVASTIAGGGAQAGGKYQGVAPGAEILDAKVFDDDGYASDSGILAAMQWAADEGAKVANMSLGGFDDAEIDPLEEAVDSLSASSGILFVVSAGNSGPGAGTIGSPGSAPAALTVGAVDREDAIADFSSVGPTADGSLKPDITAPGVDIVAAKAAEGSVGTPAGDGYIALSGTSMAAPHVAGAAAILAQRHPDWSGERLKRALTASAVATPGLTAFQQGTGRTDVAKAITQTVVTEETSLGFGTQRWVPEGAAPVTKEVTYRNEGTAAVTLDLAADAVGPDGAPAPGGLATTGTRRITVPAGGTAKVALTLDTRVSDRYGAFSGALVATEAGKPEGQSLRTAFGVMREAESYDVTMELLDNNGEPAEASPTFVDRETGEQRREWTGDGRVTLRLPKGDYLVDAPIITPTGGGDTELSQLIRQKLSVTEDTKVVFDGREAKPFDLTAPVAGQPVQASMSWNLDHAGGGTYGLFHMASLDGFSTASVGDSVSGEEFQAEVSTMLAAGGDTYSLLYTRDGSMFDGFTHRADRSEFALIEARVGSPAPGKLGSVHPMWWNDFMGVGGGGGAEVPIPSTSKQYVTTPPGYSWSFGAGQIPADVPSEGWYEVLYDRDAGRRYEAGKTYGVTLNVGVFAPDLRAGDVRRVQDFAVVCQPVFSDTSGRPGHTAEAEVKAEMTVDGKKLVEQDNPCVQVSGLPAKESAYTVRIDASREPGVARVSTRVSSEWTFTSASPGDEVVDLPLSTLGFRPELSPTSTAEAGATLRVPLVVQGNAVGKGIASLTVEASYDGGATWRKAPVTTEDGERGITLDHPASATSVSLRGALKDTEGNGYEVTIVDAYLLASGAPKA